MTSPEQQAPAKLIADALDAAMQAYDGGRGIKQSPLSRLSGVSQPTISRALKGSTMPELDTLIMLTDALGNFELGRTIGAILGAYSSARLYPKAETQVFKVEEPVVKMRTQRERDIEAINNIMKTMSDRGLVALLHEAGKIAESFPASKETPASSA